MGLRRLAPALTLCCALLAPAPVAAQIQGAPLVGPLDRTVPSAETIRQRLPQFRAPDGDLRTPGEPHRNGLIAAYPVDENLEIGIGRFRVPDLARPRTHMEAESHPLARRPRERGIAAIGFSLRFD